MLSFRDSKKSFKLDEDLLKTMTNYNFKVTHSNPQDEKMKFEIGKEINFNLHRIGWKKSNRDKSFAKLLKSPSKMVSASNVSSSHKKKIFSKMKFLFSTPIELYDWLNLLLQEQQAEFFSDIIIEEVVALGENFSEYKCKSTKQQNFLLFNCLN